MPPAAPLQYTVTFPSPHTHYAEVSLTIPAEGRESVELMMAVWTPGSYLIREFGRNIESVEAKSSDGRPLSVEKVRKNRWRVHTGGREALVSYRVYGREMSVRTNWIEADFALLNGAATFMTLADGVTRPHQVTIVAPERWRRSMTALTLTSEENGRFHFCAPDFDTLVDSPILCGNPAVHEFSVDGIPHFLVNQNEDGVFDGARAAGDLEAIVRECRRMWGSLPYEKYLFLNLITEAGGGLEHASSTVLMTSRWTTRTRRSYLDWLELASHELFHVWNVKRLRPIELGPFDYESENYTRSLWVAEGFTDYYGDLVAHRAGLSTPDEYLASLSTRIEELENTPGRMTRSVELASFDAWIKHYRPDENSPNATISYYTKGAVVAFLLDARIRRQSQGSLSLDDVMVEAMRRFGGARGYTSEEFRALVEEIAGIDLGSFWRDTVEGTSELAYDEALDTLGLRFTRKPEGKPQRAWLGINTKNDGGRLVVAHVRRDGPGSRAGINVDDEILAIDGFRVRADKLDHRLEQYRPGDRVSLLLARRDRLITLEAVFDSEPAREWRLEVIPALTESQAAQLRRWLQPATRAN